MKTMTDRREPHPTSYDHSGQMMVELWPQRPAIEAACPECGALVLNGLACREIYEELLDLENSDPDGAGSVHSLSVVCYVLQHPRLFGRCPDLGTQHAERYPEKRPYAVRIATQPPGDLQFLQAQTHCRSGATSSYTSPLADDHRPGLPP